MSSKYYSIVVSGKEASMSYEGTLNRDSGLPEGELIKLKLAVGEISIPNFSRVWAIREYTKEGKPTGNLTFIPWGESREVGVANNKKTVKGELTKIRFVQGCNSLDYEYQKEILKLVVDEDQNSEDTQILLTNGVNDFDYDTEEMLIEMLKHHTYNRDNVSRDPSNRHGLYTEFTAADQNKSNIIKMKNRKAAENIVLDAEGDERRLAVLATLFEIDPKSQDTVIFNELIWKVEDYAQFQLVVDNAKVRFKFQMEQLLQKEIIQFTEDGKAVLFMDGGSEVVLNEIPDPKNPVVSLSEDVLSPDVYDFWMKIAEPYQKLLMALQ